MTRLFRASAATAAVGALVLVLAPAAVAADTGVDIAGFAFSPQAITIKIGDTVTWSNADAQSHTATADDGAWDTGTIAGNSSKSITFNSAGTFAYHCKIHRAMTATLVIEAAAAPPPTDTAATLPAPAGDMPWLLIGLTSLLGLEIGRRRFASRA